MERSTVGPGEPSAFGGFERRRTIERHRTSTWGSFIPDSSPQVDEEESSEDEDEDEGLGASDGAGLGTGDSLQDHDQDCDAHVTFNAIEDCTPKGTQVKYLSDYIEDLKRNELIKPNAGESREAAKNRVLEDLEEHDRSNHSLQQDYRFDRGAGGLSAWHELPPASADSPRVVFMFLVVDRLKNEQWWRDWFAQADAAGHGDDYSVVFHRGCAYGREADPVVGDLLAEKGTAVWPPTKTGWARNGLVRATLLLLRYALEQARNQWFVLLSDTCMPLYSFHDLFQIIKEQKLSRFRDFGMTLDIAMQRNIWQAGVCNNERFSHKADQWAMWVRADAEWFVKENHLLKLKPMATFVDEQYFINMMDEHERPYENAGTTYTRWWKLDLPILDMDFVSLPTHKVQEGLKKFVSSPKEFTKDLISSPSNKKVQESLKKFVSSPYTFTKVDMKRIRRGRRVGCWFLRKVGANAVYPRPEELSLSTNVGVIVQCSDGAKLLLRTGAGKLTLGASSACEMCVRSGMFVLSVLTLGWISRERRVAQGAGREKED